MIGIFIVAVRMGFWSPLNWGMLAVAAICCILVFKSFVYIFNFSYGLACILNGLLLAVWFGNAPAILLGGAMALYGMRLFLFTLFRVRSESYAPRVENAQKADAAMPFGIKIALLIQCSFLYCFHLFAIYIAGQVGYVTQTVLVGAALILAGTFIEGLADAQKQKAKARVADSFVSTGLFSRWRHPNYVGEILVQVGLIIVGLGAIPGGWANYVAVTVAPLYVILLMISECGRSDRYMELRYGEREEFKVYLARSGCYLPKL
jgi:steroid 5-alpha reductase family enzyme